MQPPKDAMTSPDTGGLIKKKRRNKSGEQRLNLNRSWHKDHSHAYNTSFCFKSYTKDLSFPIFVIALEHNGPAF